MTSVSPELLAILVCPKCKGDLRVEPEALCCDTCKLRYRIDDGIPVMLIDEAEPIVDGPPSSASAASEG